MLQSQLCWIKGQTVNIFLRVPVSQGDIPQDDFFMVPIHAQCQSSHVAAFVTAEPVKQATGILMLLWKPS